MLQTQKDPYPKNLRVSKGLKINNQDSTTTILIHISSNINLQPLKTLSYPETLIANPCTCNYQDLLKVFHEYIYQKNVEHY